LNVLSGAASSWSPNGKRIAYECNRPAELGAICITSPSGGYKRQLTSPKNEDEHPSWSPNGKMIVFQRYREGAGVGSIYNEIYVINADGSHLHQLTHGGDDEAPAWQPRN